MFRNKTNLVVFVVIIAVVSLICASIVTFNSIEEAKKENEVANLKIEGLGSAMDLLQSELDKTNEEILNHEERIQKYQEIIVAWSKATPNVNEAIKRITSAYEDVINHAYLFENKKLEGLEDQMMDAVFGAIRSSTPTELAVSFEKSISQLNEGRFDNVIKAKITKIKQNGVTFPEDTMALSELRTYYNSFAENLSANKFFKENGLDKEIANLELLVDTDEENDLAKAFERSVTEIKTPITSKTTLNAANTAWDAFCASLESDDVISNSVSQARALLDSYTERVNQLILAKEEAERINSKIDALQVKADLSSKNAIASLESEISAWKKKFEIDEANTSLVKDLSTVKAEFEQAVLELKSLYEAYKKEVEGIGKVNVNSKAKIDAAFKAYDDIKNYKDANKLLSLKGENTIEKLLEKLQGANNSYNYLVSLVESIRLEIDRIHNVDPDISKDEIASLNCKVDELLSLESSINVINTEKVNYVSRLEEARLLPYKNEAFAEIKAAYDTCYARANNNRDIILALVEIKDSSLKAIENAKNVNEINSLVERAKNSFEDCFK